MPLPLHHLAVLCHDLAACELFYREVLGLEVVQRWPDGAGGDRSVWLGLGGGAFLALERAERAPAASPWAGGQPGLHLLALRIEPSRRAWWRAHLEAVGAPVVHETGWTLYVRDPEGNRIGLSHHPEAAP